MQANLKYLIELSKHNFKLQCNSMQNIAYRFEDMKSYFKENETHKCRKNRFHEMQSSSLIDIPFSMRKNLCNARGKSKIYMQTI